MFTPTTQRSHYHKKSLQHLSNPEVGSSRNSIPGARRSSVAIARRFLSPPDKPFFWKVGSVPPISVFSHFTRLVSFITCFRDAINTTVSLTTLPDHGHEEQGTQLFFNGNSYLSYPLLNLMRFEFVAHACYSMITQVLLDFHETKEQLLLMDQGWWEKSIMCYMTIKASR